MTTTTTTTRFVASSLTHRAVAFGLAALVSMSLLSGVSVTADHVHDEALMAQVDSATTQVVVVTAKRLPRV